MYNYHINETSAANTPKPLSIRLNCMPFNERAAFVETVCASLIDSRFGQGRSVPVIHHLTEQPETEMAILDDMTYECTSHAFMTAPDLRIARSNTVDAVSRQPQHFEHACISIHFQNLSPPNQGRGSP